MFKVNVLSGLLPLGDCAGLAGSSYIRGLLGVLVQTLFEDGDGLEVLPQWAAARAGVQQGAGTSGSSRAQLSLCIGGRDLLSMEEENTRSQKQHQIV